MNPTLVEVLRGGAIESSHRGALAVLDADGAVRASLGHIDHPIFARSAVKVLQALPLVESGAADALGLTDRAIARRRSLSLRSVQNRLQHLYEKLDVYQMAADDHDDSRFNLRARAVTVALLRKLLNYSSLERAEAELADWLKAD